MHYYYDVLINIDEETWEFYEWDKEDQIIPIKKVPLIRISEKIFLDILNYHGQITPTFLEPYIEKTICKKYSKNMNLLLISTTNHSLIIEFSIDGNILSRSKLLIEDENDINEQAKTLKEQKIPYQKEKKIETRKDFRQALQEKNLIKIELKTILKDQNISKCKYLYYEWFGQISDNLEKMITTCYQELKKPYTLKIHEVASLIRLSYKEPL